MMNMIHTELRGMAWSHPRGIDPLRACVPLLEQQGIRIRWDARSLQGFEEASITQLAETYDLIAIDHPFMGDAFQQGALQPVDDLIGDAFQRELAESSVGPSFESYRWGGKLWAVPVDAAAQVAAFRHDLLAKSGARAPSSWEEVFALAGTSPVALAANPTHMLLAFATICNAFAADRSAQDDLRPAWWGDDGIDMPTALKALECLQQMMVVAHPASWEYDPIMLFEHMVNSDDIAYTPIAFGYSNYARPGDYDRPLSFTGVPSRDGEVIGGMLGGVGIAVSRHCRHPHALGTVLRFLASADVQGGIYAQAGGQPAHRSAWTSSSIEAVCPNFFAPTLPSLDRSFVRPRIPAYPRFQREGGELLHELMKQAKPIPRIAAALNDLWRQLCQPAMHIK